MQPSLLENFPLATYSKQNEEHQGTNQAESIPISLFLEGNKDRTQNEHQNPQTPSFFVEAKTKLPTNLCNSFEVTFLPTCAHFMMLVGHLRQEISKFFQVFRQIGAQAYMVDCLVA
jgi:hypothetical protein